VVARGEVGRKPAAIGHDVAAAAATPGLTALQLLRDKGRLASGGRVLVIGAAGGVGSLAVGVAQQLGATVTAVCSARAIEFVRGLGAAEVIDRSQRDPRSAEGPFEIVIDAAAAYGFASLRHLLTRDGAYLTTLPSGAFIGGKLMSLVSRRRCHLVVVRSVSADLEQLAAWIAAGMKVPIDMRFPVRDLRQALDRLASGQVCGRVGVRVEGGF
jgi:NADPH:quinone reductase-like Zn-dependent oxidoreductase